MGELLLLLAHLINPRMTGLVEVKVGPFLTQARITYKQIPKCNFMNRFIIEQNTGYTVLWIIYKLLLLLINYCNKQVYYREEKTAYLENK